MMGNSNTITKLILMCGFPGSGKSTFLNKFQQDNPEHIVICPDNLRLTLTGQNYWKPAEDMIWTMAKIFTQSILEHQKRPVIIDATNNSFQFRNSWIGIARNLNCPCECFWYRISHNVASERNGKRTKNKTPQSVIDSMYKMFSPPVLSEGYSKVRVFINCDINQERDFAYPEYIDFTPHDISSDKQKQKEYEFYFDKNNL